MVNPSRPTREDYYRVLADALPANAAVVTALGNASYLWAALRDAPENFYLEDAMGLALPLALGLAVARPDRRIVVVEGDGGLLMHMGGLVTVAAMAPANLTVLLIDNGVHGASGGQALASQSVDLAGLARAAGLTGAQAIGSVDEFRAALGHAFETAEVSLFALGTAPDTESARPPVALDPVAVKRRFAEAIDAPRYVPTLFGGGMLEKP